MGAKKITGKSILVVDDEADFRDILAISFEAAGFKVFKAANGREAFDLIVANSIDVVVSDIRMPGGDGVELLERAKARSPETPIVLLVTGYTELSTADAHDKGAEAMFAKPFRIADVQETIDRLLLPPEKRWAHPERIEVEFSSQLRFSNRTIGAKVLNLGRGGMFVQIQGHLPEVNEQVSFEVDFGGQPLVGSGTVRWVRPRIVDGLPSGFGIEFSFLPEPQRVQLIEFIEKNKPRAYIPKS